MEWCPLGISTIYKIKPMATYYYTVEFSIMKGLGPDWVPKLVDVVFDDVEDDTPEYVVKQWAKDYAEGILRRPGSEIEKLVFVDIHNA